MGSKTFKGGVHPYEGKELAKDQPIVEVQMCIRDRLSYALFPQVATEFFKYREAQQKKVDASVADTKNGAYPV